jgi:hypothetical protein
MASHFLICDSNGTVAGIEWLDGKMTVYTGSSLPIPAMVNTAYESCLANGDDRSGRFRPLAEMYAAYDTAKDSNGVSYVFSMLKAAELFSPPFQTQWSMAYDVHAGRIYWKTMSNSKLRYVDLKDFDFSCKSPVEVLDINCSGKDNVKDAFAPYTIDFNREYVARIYALYNEYSDFIGQTYSQDKIDGIIAFPESTVCNVASKKK